MVSCACAAEPLEFVSPRQNPSFYYYDSFSVNIGVQCRIFNNISVFLNANHNFRLELVVQNLLSLKVSFSCRKFKAVIFLKSTCYQHKSFFGFFWLTIKAKVVLKNCFIVLKRRPCLPGRKFSAKQDCQ